MSTRSFDIVFDGSVINGSDPLEVKSKLKALFKLDDAAADKLFVGKPIAIKRNIDRKTATQYQTAINKAGAKIQIVLHKPVQNNQNQNQKTQTSPRQDTAPAPIKAETSKPVPPLPPASNVAALSLAPSGGHLISDNERSTTPAIAVKTDHLELERSKANPFMDALDNPSTANTTGSTEPSYPNPNVEKAPDLSFISEEEISKAVLDTKERINALIAQESAKHTFEAELSEAGEELLREDEKRVHVAKEIDLSHISVAEQPS